MILHETDSDNLASYPSHDQCSHAVPWTTGWAYPVKTLRGSIYLNLFKQLSAKSRKHVKPTNSKH